MQVLHHCCNLLFVSYNFLTEFTTWERTEELLQLTEVQYDIDSPEIFSRHVMNFDNTPL